MSSRPQGCPCAATATGSPDGSDASCFLWGSAYGRRGWWPGPPLLKPSLCPGRPAVSLGRGSLKPQVLAQGKEGAAGPEGQAGGGGGGVALPWACLPDIMTDPGSRSPNRCRPLVACVSSPSLACFSPPEVRFTFLLSQHQEARGVGLDEGARVTLSGHFTPRWPLPTSLARACPAGHFPSHLPEELTEFDLAGRLVSVFFQWPGALGSQQISSLDTPVIHS